MKKLFTLTLLLAGLLAQAQFSTPGTGVNWNLDSLVNKSGGAVTWNDDHYEITTTLTILPADSITVFEDVTLLFHELAGIESEGTLLIDAPVQSVFTSIDTTATTNRWRGFKLLENHVTHIKNAKFAFGGGLRVQSGTFTIDGSTFYKNFYKSGSSAGSYTSGAALDISGNAEVTNCNFTLNQRGAISSGSNVPCRAIIRNNYIFGNTTENSNRPQINMGPSGGSDTTYIVGNTIIGDGNTRAGGIAYSSLLGLAGNVVIDSNIVDLNRYGITLTGSPINSAIRYNTITNNNIENNPAVGGSGLNFTASNESSNQQVMVTGNIISGNLWGITIIGYPQVNMGDSAAATFNPGGNVFSDNGNEDMLYDLYNNGPVNQTAMYNCWGVETQDSASIETVVVHIVDDPTLGRVDFMPSCAFQTTFIVQDDAEALLSDVEIEIEDQDESLTTNANGAASVMLPPNSYNFTATLEGYKVYAGNVTVVYGNNTVNIVLETLYTVTFTVENMIAGSEIQINQETLIPNEDGIATIELPNGEYPFTLTAPEYPTFNGTVTVDGEDVEVFISTGIHNPLISALKVYPNPVVDRLILEGVKIDAAEVFSITGQLLLQIKQVNGFIDLSSLNKGVYLIRVKSQGSETTIRVVKE
ncbi:MAG: T9SS type A sorting domain-containing protein [Bacteroidales bacterium]|nr:T9SS type A sorting domain-containing protein [Bacteroidales bacterium]